MAQGGMPYPAARRTLLLVGGGHAHLFVLEAFARKPEPDLAIVLVARGRFTPYSGMLPGHVAGLYERRRIHVDLARLAQSCGATFHPQEAVALEPERRVLRL